MVKNIDLAKKGTSNKLLIFGNDRIRSCLKRIWGYDTGEEEVGSRQSIAR